MKSETKKFEVKRELKFRVPNDTLKIISTACEGYGNGRIVAEASGVTYNTLAAVLQTKLATKNVLNSILAGIEKVAIETSI